MPLMLLMMALLLLLMMTVMMTMMPTIASVLLGTDFGRTLVHTACRSRFYIDIRRRIALNLGRRSLVDKQHPRAHNYK